MTSTEEEKRLIPLIQRWKIIFRDIKSYKAIHLKCIRCCGGNRKAPSKCEDFNCPLFPWKTGRSELRWNYKEIVRGKNGKFIHTVDTVAKTKLEQITGISEGVFVPKKKWDEIQEKLKEENETSSNSKNREKVQEAT